MDSYFKRTVRGRQRAGRILPEPFFVHSHLTTGIQIADLVAYVVSWGFRLRAMVKPARPELAGYTSQVSQLRHRSICEVAGNPEFSVWSFVFITEGHYHRGSTALRISIRPDRHRRAATASAHRLTTCFPFDDSPTLSHADRSVRTLPRLPTEA